MLLPLANTLFTVKLGLRSTNALAEAGQRGCNDAGMVPPVTVAKDGSIMALPKPPASPGLEQAGKGPGSMCRSSSLGSGEYFWYLSLLHKHPSQPLCSFPGH